MAGTVVQLEPSGVENVAVELDNDTTVRSLAELLANESGMAEDNIPDNKVLGNHSNAPEEEDIEETGVCVCESKIVFRVAPKDA